ncbi:16S rRNA (adenine(1518)-N(6)/adenine(1519)-N(6))-dimethyltransferase RsmA [Bifidobacterium xylocopae]|uniref:Ribosomal RNA small subunit methyltransferase A n=1 Tax=Bifidobacterium xylocopae TaxID=2493119 RepID=A0A366KDN1_9BIFI|nr:16S rRNA (adenine(1518)-N(6)/adenine(1519)-N(6))-dimethyltransferase RsmA [Bifidobacterium xylocopae]RBP99679.1 16S rRNA (adenine(1518)-N(6)/adenine(1519)-N(6))-dimethyltransferase [Bifidobacterium xylocopae]
MNLHRIPDAPDPLAGSGTNADHLLGAADIRRLAERAGVSPSKKLGQNFVIDPGTVRRIVREAGVGADNRVLEVGPGLGSLTLGLLESGAVVTAVEIDPRLATLLPQTVEAYMPQALDRFDILTMDALALGRDTAPGLAQAQTLTLVANLPYNVATPVLLTLLERFDNLAGFLVMVQKEVADRLTARPGTKTYGVPSAKLAWYGRAEPAGRIGRSVFWPAPNVDSALVAFTRFSKDDGDGAAAHDPALRNRVFELIDASFAQRRKTLRAALSGRIQEEAFTTAGIDPKRRGETLSVNEFSKLAAADAVGRMHP